MINVNKMLTEKKQFGCLGKFEDARNDGVDETNVADAVLLLGLGKYPCDG